MVAAATRMVTRDGVMVIRGGWWQLLAKADGWGGCGEVDVATVAEVVVGDGRRS